MEKMTRVDSIISARWIIPVAPKGTVLENHSVLINDGRIFAVLPTSEAESNYESDDWTKLGDEVLLPGFVNLHSHAAMNLVRGLGADLPLMEWLTKEIWPAEGRLMSPEFVEEGSFLAGLEMARGGTTTASDHYFFPESAAAGLRRAGLRCAVSGIVIGFPSAWCASDEEYLARAEELLKAHEGDEYVRATVAPHAPYTVSDESLAKCAELSRKYSAPIHMHVNETSVEVEGSLKEHGERPIQRLKRLGLLTDKLIAVHSVHASAEDIEEMKNAGASMCHCPCSNLKLASGFAPFADFIKSGVNVGIGTDGAASNDKLDMLGESRLAAMLAKAASGDPTAAKVHDVIEAATLGGARALHWDDRIGSIEPGKEADLVSISLSEVNSIPVQDPAAQLLYAADRSDVTRTWVHGRLIYARDELNIQTNYSDNVQQAKQIAENWKQKLLG